MSVYVRVIADSVAPCGERLFTVECTYPRIILAEVNTHRDLSRNSASSRAIPIDRMIQRVLDDPGAPVHWGKNQKGMQAEEELDAAGRQAAQDWWTQGVYQAVEHARQGQALGLHKQVVNRVLEPYQHMVTLISATRWANFFHLRCHKAADPTFQLLARTVYTAYATHKPRTLGVGEWHLPYINAEDRVDAYALAGDTTHAIDERARIGLEILKKVAVGRCARTSYVNQDGWRALADDIALHDRLMASAGSGEPGHWSPFEHVAMALGDRIPSGNFLGFRQYRKEFSNEVTSRFPNV